MPKVRKPHVEKASNLRRMVNDLLERVESLEDQIDQAKPARRAKTRRARVEDDEDEDDEGDEDEDENEDEDEEDTEEPKPRRRGLTLMG